MLALPVEAAVPAAKDKTHRRRHALPLQCAFFLVEAAVPAARGPFAGDTPATTAATPRHYPTRGRSVLFHLWCGQLSAI